MNKEERAILRRAVERARRLLEDEVADQLEGAFGILQSGKVLDDAPGDPTVRQRLLELITHHQAGGETVKEAVERATRELAFTTLNRFVALKMAERRGLVRECISKGPMSDGIRELADCAPGLRAALPDGGYRLLLEAVMDEISLGLSALFDRRAPAGLIWPRPKALDELLDILNAAELAGLWEQDETIGWVYQYFNRKEERDEMRKASRSPRNTRELAVRNQFFTPRYVVAFLTDNTLGRIWYEMRKGDTALKEGCRYLVRRPSEVFLEPGEPAPPSKDDEADLTQEELLRRPVYIEHRPKKDPRDIKVLDPACGSGHFLLYAFELLERIYEEAWADSEGPASAATGRTLREDYGSIDELRRAAPKLIIEHNLHGVDIDPRAVQIAALALWLRAQKAWQGMGLRPTERPQILRSNIVTAEPMPGEDDMRRELVDSLRPRVLGQLVEVVFERMRLAGEAGSLLTIEEEIKEGIADARRQWLESPEGEQLLLFPGMGRARPEQQTLRFDLTGVDNVQFWEEAEGRILEALRDYANRTENGGAFRRRLFVDDADRGFAFIDLCRKRYDVILMNPPFGASSRNAKEYIEENYASTKGDLLANFIERTLQLTSAQGLVGAISSRTPFFLGSFKELRTEILSRVGRVHLLADLGDGVLEAMVETAIYVLARRRRSDSSSLFFRILVDEDKAEVLRNVTRECSEGRISGRAFVASPESFEALGGAPYAYWVSNSTIQCLSAHPRIEGNKAEIRVGMQTGDDFRFLRCFWEVSPRLVSPAPIRRETKINVRQHCLRELSSKTAWAPFSKTEAASPWFSPITLVAKWAGNGHELRNFTNEAGNPRSALRSEQEYFKPGFSYMLRSTRLVPYLVPSGVIPTAGRAQIFPVQGQEYTVLGLCASNVGSAVARFSGENFARPKFQASMVQGLPACDLPGDTLTRVKERVDREVNKRRAVLQRYEPFQEFTLPAWADHTGEGDTSWDLYSLLGRDLEIEIAKALGLDAEQLSELERDIREAIAIRAPSEDNDSDDGEEGAEEGEAALNIELISETPEEKAIGAVQYAVGTVLGRWDIRIALNRSLAPKLPEPFDALPICPPGMLVNPSGLPAEAGSIVSEEWLRARPDALALPSEGTVKQATIKDSEYPIQVCWDGILVDDPGLDGNQPHRDDIVLRVREALEVVWKDRAHEVEQEACKILGVPTLRDYFRKPSRFFDDHLKRYSQSRRKAPIYWPLSTASGAYTVWVYYHRLTEDTLYRLVSDYVSPKISEVEDRITQREAEHRSAQGRDAARLAKELSELTSLLQELNELRDELLRVAHLPYRPNLNDGVQITAAPLWRLFRLPRWRSELERTWQALERGDYDWAHLAYAIWPERVRETCRRDRSIAIAHGLEELYEERSAPQRHARRRRGQAG